MIETATVSPDDIEVEPPKPGIALLPPTCDAAENDAIVAGLQQAAADGSDIARGHMARVRSINGQIASARASMQTARQSYASGDMSAARKALTDARATVEDWAASRTVPISVRRSPATWTRSTGWTGC